VVTDYGRLVLMDPSSTVPVAAVAVLILMSNLMPDGIVPAMVNGIFTELKTTFLE
jgi:hypothetical protein